ncbi:hypothetical protein NG799_21505 [Laspinema sp. D1]|uniref:Uncharacterized protein n=1 Tax=Laspinema palackyanum D2a TaxID=2953684 RepID=A0ABT2MVZ1_9CYAN|nr:hypothetical protein [Laspinema sp. D2b]MCT7968890.1 hypothetical protein [Laspinema sp. D2a]
MNSRVHRHRPPVAGNPTPEWKLTLGDRAASDPGVRVGICPDTGFPKPE